MNSLIQHFETQILNSGIILKTFTHVIEVYNLVKSTQFTFKQKYGLNDCDFIF